MSDVYHIKRVPIVGMWKVVEYYPYFKEHSSICKGRWYFTKRGAIKKALSLMFPAIYQGTVLSADGRPITDLRLR